MHSTTARATGITQPGVDTKWITGNDVTINAPFDTPFPDRYVTTITLASDPTVEYYSHTDDPYSGNTGDNVFKLNLKVPSVGAGTQTTTITAKGFKYDGTPDGTPARNVTITIL